MEGSRLNEMFEKAGRYRFGEQSLCCRQEWIFLWNHERELGSGSLVFRLGSEIGSLYISCYDVYSNRMAFKAYPQLEVHVYKMGTPSKINIEKASGCITQDRIYLQV